MLSVAPEIFARSIAWRTASPAVSDPSVPTTMRVNTRVSLRPVPVPVRLILVAVSAAMAMHADYRRSWTGSP